MGDEKRNIYQRIRDVSTEATKLEKTGKTQFGSKATSIGDVENALRGPMVEHGVITRWSYQEDGLIDLSNGKLWMAKLRVTVVNADNSSDFFVDDWSDIGSNPMAATSFARKGYFKALFHLTGDEDESHAPAPDTKRTLPKNVDRETGEIPFEPIEQEQPARRFQASDSYTDEIPKASPNKPASANQLATVAKLSRLLGHPEEPSEDWTSADASERITELSREYNERVPSAKR